VRRQDVASRVQAPQGFIVRTASHMHIVQVGLAEGFFVVRASLARKVKGGLKMLFAAFVQPQATAEKSVPRVSKAEGTLCKRSFS